MNHRPFALARQVNFLSGEQNYCWTHYLSGYRDLRRGPLCWVTQQYPSFVRIHKQYAINPDHLVGLHKQPRYRQRPLVEVELRGGIRLPVAQSRLIYLWPRLNGLLRAITGLEGIPETLDAKPLFPFAHEPTASV